MSRHNWSVSDEIWARCQKAAAAAGAERGLPMSVSEWLRGLVFTELDKMETDVHMDSYA